MRGGVRAGAGRPKGSGKFGEKTKPIRVPECIVEEVLTFIEYKGYKLPLYSCSVSAGFPSPADDYTDKSLDLNEHLIKNPSATFFVRVNGNSMINAGIHDGDTLIVDRSIEPTNNKVVVAAVDGQLTVKRLLKKSDAVYLIPENDAYSAIELTEGNNVKIWGVVTTVLHSV
ncbi:MAG: DNA polymerase V [Legionellales bacterium]|nr:DNA polymerase V [Legionellales bacterium]|tara:strand:+ start:807 stop:1319 length:513 start_codon:yes stop_codon:yes gene_type:complete